MKRPVKWLGIALIACVALGIVAAIISSGNKNAGTANAPAAQQGQAGVGQPAAQPAPGMGMEVVAGKIAWKVTSANPLGRTLKSDNQFIEDKTTSGSFVRVSYRVENRGTDQVYFTAPKLVDSQNREFSDYNEASFFIPQQEQCVLKALNPNVPAECTVIYEIAADAKQIKAKVTSLALLGGSPAWVELGANLQ